MNNACKLHFSSQLWREQQVINLFHKLVFLIIPRMLYIYIYMETHACTLQTYGRDQTIKQKKFRRGERSFAGSLCHTKEHTERTTLGHAPKNQDQSHDHDDVPVLSHVSIVWSAV